MTRYTSCRSDDTCSGRCSRHARGAPSPGHRILATKAVTILASALVLVSVSFALTGPAGASDGSPEADSAIAWMDAELAANGGNLPGFLEGTVDWGLMGDFAIARIASGHAGDPATIALAQRLLDNLGSYSTWDDQPDAPGVRSAGALAKVYLVALGAGLDTSDVDGVDLETELRSLMNTSGDQAGRFADRNPFGPDYSLMLGQAWAMMALSHTDGGVPPESVAFVVDQQCPSGGFRLLFEVTPGCEDDSEADPDATALVAQVLLGLDRSAALDEVLSDAIEWLTSRQQDDGSFGGGKYTEAPNANSTGLISQTLRAAGLTAGADSARDWVLGELQLGPNADGTPAAEELGAIAYDPAARAEALESGIAPGARDQWRRASSQGVLALGAGLLVEVVDPPGSTTTTSSSTTTTTSTTTAPTSTNPAPPGAAEDGSGAPGSADGTPVAPESGPPSGVAAEQVAVPSASGGYSTDSPTASGSTSSGPLARTGSEGLAPVRLALVLMGSGLVALTAGRLLAVRRNGTRA